MSKCVWIMLFIVERR